MQSEQQTLVFTGITAASRDEARKIKVGMGREHIYIPYDKISLKENGNFRKPAIYQTREEWIAGLGLEELADQIYANNGPSDAIEGDVEKGTGLFFITEGQRRHMAIGLLIDRGLEFYPNNRRIDAVEVLCNPSGFTDAERLRKNHSSQNKLPLKPSELAAGFLLYKNSVKREDGTPVSNEDIATDFGFSRQYIDAMIKINDLEPATLQKLDEHQISQADALATLRKKKEKPAYTGEKELIEMKDGTIEVAAGSVDEFFDQISIKEEESIPVDDEEEGTVPLPVWTETKAALDAEEESRKTSRTVPEQKNTERDEAEEAMIVIDYRADKLQGEYLINETISNLDKMTVKIKALPDNLKQYKDDLENLAVWTINKQNELREILKKAADTR